jgi:hypothetical protein
MCWFENLLFEHRSDQQSTESSHLSGTCSKPMKKKTLYIFLFWLIVTRIVSEQLEDRFSQSVLSKRSYLTRYKKKIYIIHRLKFKIYKSSKV